VPAPTATLTLGHLATATLQVGHLATATLRFVDSPTAALRFYAVQAHGGSYAAPAQEALVSGTLVGFGGGAVRGRGAVPALALVGSKGLLPDSAVGVDSRISFNQGRLANCGPVPLGDGVHDIPHVSQTSVGLYGRAPIVPTKAMLQLSESPPQLRNYAHAYTHGPLLTAAQDDE